MRRPNPTRLTGATTLAILTVIGLAATARADHTTCRDEPAPSSPTAPAAHASTQDTYIQISSSRYVGVDLDGASGNRADICINTQSNETGVGVLTINNSDQNPTSTGKQITIQGTGSLSAINLGTTGAEAGTPGCGSGGTCLTGTRIWMNGLSLGTAARTGVDENHSFPVVTEGTTSAHNIACVGSECVRSRKISAGRIDVYADNNTPTPVHLCASIGPNMSCP